MSDFGEMKSPRAAKQHQCTWCQEPILKGEIHKQYVGMYDGDWQNWRMHDDCLKASNRERQHGDDDELCSERHPRGKTCGEVDDERWKQRQKAEGAK